MVGALRFGSDNQMQYFPFEILSLDIQALFGLFLPDRKTAGICRIEDVLRT